MQVVLYSDDINFLDYWSDNLENSIIVDDLIALYDYSSCLIILNYTACKPSCAVVLQKLSYMKNKVLILHSTPDLETAKNVLKLGASGYGNTLMRKHFLDAAINAIKDGMVWLHPEFTTKLILDIEESPSATKEKILKKLSVREREVAIWLKEGYTYNELGVKLNITPRTVKAHAQKVYMKLGVKDRLSLALLLR